MSIATENAKQIRNPMNVFVTMSNRSKNVDVSVSATGNIAAKDTNVSTSIDADAWPMRGLADFQGEGFPADGSCVAYNSTVAGSLENGKLGIRSTIGGTMTISVTSTARIIALTIEIDSGEGTITANGETYDIAQVVVVPVNGTSITMVVASTDPERRVEIASITPGVTLELNNDNILYCTLALRSDLSMVEPSWPVSEIEVQAYWTADISEIVANLNDNVPITYRAGYPGSYSPVRLFYLSEPVDVDRNIITIKGEDASARLDRKQIALQRKDTENRSGHKTLYQFFRDSIKACGIKPSYVQAAPANVAVTKAITRSAVLQERSTREYVQDIINLGHTGSFWPLFVDAGIPRITWSKPTKKWDIYEEDCGDVVRIVDRNITKLTTDDENGLHSNATRGSSWVNLYADNDDGALGGTLSVKKGDNVIKNFDDYYWAYSVTGQTTTRVWSRLQSLCFRPTKTSVKKGSKWLYKVKVRGKPLNVSGGVEAIEESTKRPGVTAEISPLTLGRVYMGDSFVYPNYNHLFSRSNVSGSFLWKGDPRMQPRDVFYFHRLDGTVETCSIESIELSHEEGGTTATISYRLGVV